jgi:hypothetical protein
MTSGGSSWPASLRSSQDAGAYQGANSDAIGLGSRRKKLAGYLRSANEMRQAYQQSWSTRDGTADMPGSFPGGASAERLGEEEMLLFPSYARRHIKEKVSFHGMARGV